MSLTDEDGETSIDVTRYIAKCWRFTRLYTTSLALAFVVGLASYVCAPRQYTAVAVLGPVTSATPSSYSLVGSAVAMLGNKLSGGADAEQMFTEYSQLLTSTRLSQTLIEKHDIFGVVFHDQWDTTQKQWKVGKLRALKNWLSSILGTYPKSAPDADDLDHYFDKHLHIEQVSPVASSSLLSTSSMLRVSFDFDDPYASAKILGEILNEADSILRSDQKKDVDARIRHIEDILPTVTVTDQREALITVLSNQLETQTLIQSDKRYGSVLVDPPHASLTPTSPKLIQTMVVAALFALVIATGLILGFPPEHRLLRPFDRHKAKRL